MKKLLSILLLLILSTSTLFSDYTNYTSNTIKNKSNDEILWTKWSEWINKNETIPDNWFKRISFDSNTKKIIESKEVDNIALFNYSDRNALAWEKTWVWVYWMWYINIEENWNYPLHVYQSWSNAKVYIDDELIHDWTSSKTTEINLKKWKYKIEIQFVNSWHVASFLVNLETNKDIEEYFPLDSKFEIKTALWDDYNVYYAWTYESWFENGNINVWLENIDNEKNFALILSSFRPVNWNLVWKNDKLKVIIFWSCQLWAKIYWYNKKIFRWKTLWCNYKSSDWHVATFFPNKRYNSLSLQYSTKDIKMESIKKLAPKTNNKYSNLEKKLEKIFEKIEKKSIKNQKSIYIRLIVQISSLQKKYKEWTQKRELLDYLHEKFSKKYVEVKNN